MNHPLLFFVFNEPIMKARWQLFELQLLLDNNDVYNSGNLPFYTNSQFDSVILTQCFIIVLILT